MSIFGESALGVFEKKGLQRIYALLRVGNGKYSRYWNDELYELYDDVNINQLMQR